MGDIYIQTKRDGVPYRRPKNLLPFSRQVTQNSTPRATRSEPNFCCLVSQPLCIILFLAAPRNRDAPQTPCRKCAWIQTSSPTQPAECGFPPPPELAFTLTRTSIFHWRLENPCQTPLEISMDLHLSQEQSKDLGNTFEEKRDAKLNKQKS